MRIDPEQCRARGRIQPAVNRVVGHRVVGIRGEAADLFEHDAVIRLDHAAQLAGGSLSEELCRRDASGPGGNSRLDGHGVIFNFTVLLRPGCSLDPFCCRAQSEPEERISYDRIGRCVPKQRNSICASSNIRAGPLFGSVKRSTVIKIDVTAEPGLPIHSGDRDVQSVGRTGCCARHGAGECVISISGRGRVGNR
ncbi:hypothetical protein D3C74_73700 [compost metagenome]